MNTPEGTVWRTPNLACPACQMGCVHSKELLGLYHPFSGHGYNGTNWSHMALDELGAARRGTGTTANAYTERAQLTQRGN
jgi:hypothetical protein